MTAITSNEVAQKLHFIRSRSASTISKLLPVVTRLIATGELHSGQTNSKVWTNRPLAITDGCNIELWRVIAHMTLKNNEAMRVLRVRQLFEVRPSEERTEAGVLLFCTWLEKHYPHLLPPDPAIRTSI